MNNQNYRDTFKATTIFASVQLITIVIAVVKSKTVALWLGPYGLGLLSLFSSVTGMIFSISNLGIASSGVKEVASTLIDKNKLANLIISLKRWAVGTGIAGAIITIAFSPLISKLTFNSENYTLSLIFLSVVVLLNGINSVNLAIIQGTQNIRTLAVTNIYGALLGFVISVPLYYFFGIKSIVISIILTSIAIALLGEYQVRKLNLTNGQIYQSWGESWHLGKTTVKLGIMISISFIVLTISEFIIKIFMGRIGGVDAVGFYQAGWTLNTTYLGMVFTAMSTDFFPRLSVDAGNDEIVKTKVNQQAEIAMLILGPLIAIMIVSLPLIVRILFTKEFLVIVDMTRLLLFGSLLKAGSWTISFIFLAKGNGKLYLFNELAVKAITLPTYLLLFYFFGLKGIGIAFILDQLIYLIWVSVAAWINYRFNYSFEFFKILFVLGGLSLLSLLFLFYSPSNIGLIVSIISVLIISIFSVNKLNKKMELIPLIKQKFLSGKK